MFQKEDKYVKHHGIVSQMPLKEKVLPTAAITNSWAPALGEEIGEHLDC